MVLIALHLYQHLSGFSILAPNLLQKLLSSCLLFLAGFLTKGLSYKPRVETLPLEININVSKLSFTGQGILFAPAMHRLRPISERRFPPPWWERE